MEDSFRSRIKYGLNMWLCVHPRYREALLCLFFAFFFSLRAFESIDGHGAFKGRVLLEVREPEPVYSEPITDFFKVYTKAHEIDKLRNSHSRYGSSTACHLASRNLLVTDPQPLNSSPGIRCQTAPEYGVPTLPPYLGSAPRLRRRLATRCCHRNFPRLARSFRTTCAAAFIVVG